MSTAERRLTETIRAEGARILATLVRIVGDLHVAEDAVQEAAIRALRQWPVTGVPSSPRAWLTVTARRAAIDLLRREGARFEKERAAVELHLDDDPPEDVINDDLLRLIFTCAHPALSLEAQVTLALRVLCGLSTTQIAAVLLTEARRDARTDADGNPIVLAEQNRAAWNAAEIDEGRRLLDASLRRCEGIADPYQLQAAIAAIHDTAPSYRETDWAEIVRLYDLLIQVHPNSAAHLGRAVAVAEHSGAAAGLALLDEIAPDHRWHAVRAELLARDGHHAEAIDAMAASLAGPVTVSDAEAQHRRRLITRWNAQVQ